MVDSFEEALVMNILISKPDALGDQLIAAGFLQQLLAARPEARIFWHVRSGMGVIETLLSGVERFDLNPRADPVLEAERLEETTPGKIYLLEYMLNPADDFNPEVPGRLQWWKTFLQACKWDIAAAPVVNRTWLSDITVAMSGAERRLGFRANNTYPVYSKYMLKALGIDIPCFTEEMPPSFRESEYIQLGNMFARLIDRKPDFSIQLDIGMDEKPSDKKIAVLAPGVGWNSKRAWPLEKFLKAAEHLRKKRFQVVWVEGPSDGNIFKEFPEELQDERRTFPADALSSLTRQFSRAALVVCNDTLYAHLAAALDRPAVAIFTAGMESRFFPRRGRVKVVQGAIPCAGCQWHCIYDQMHCVMDIPVKTVVQAIDAVIGNGDYETRMVPIKLPTAQGQDADLETIRDRLQESWMREFWDNWTRLQMLQRAGFELDKAEAHRIARQEAFQKLEQDHRDSKADRKILHKDIKNLERVNLDNEAERIALHENLRKNEAERIALHEDFKNLERVTDENEAERLALKEALRKSEADRADRLEAIRNLEGVVKKKEEEITFFKHIVYHPIATFKFWGKLLWKDLLRLGRRLRFWKK